MKFLAAGLCATVMAAVSHPVLAQAVFAKIQQTDTAVETEPGVGELFVWGKRSAGIGVAESASEGEVSFSTFNDRPLLRPGELAEVVPGLAATQHSGTGKANQYFLRGFNLDHGTDFSVSLDGAPLNLRTHGHGQGYLDLNSIIPETVQTIHYNKGVYSARLGDFSAAGGAAFQTFDQLPRQSLDLSAGENAYGRLTGLKRLGETSWLAADATVSDGPWETPEHLRKGSLLGRFALGDWSVTGLAYGARWTSTDQIPERAVATGLLSRFGAVDTTDGGRTERFILAAQRHSDDGWNANLYAQRYRLNLFSNFTYFLEDPVNGDQFEQADSRWIYGGAISRTWPAIYGWDVTTGLEGRYDAIDNVGLYRTVARVRTATVRQDQVDEYSGALWLEARRNLGPLRIDAGLRLDSIGADVSSDNALNSGNAGDFIASPKLAVAWRISDSLEAYFNAGQGFHSNDARGATITVDPVTAAAAPQVDLFVPATGGEVGLRWQRNGLQVTGTVWGLDLDSELVYVGDAGATEASGATRRVGGEVLVDWQLARDFTIDLTAASTHARFRDAPSADRIPNAVEYVVTGGFTWKPIENLSTTVTLRHLGPAPLIEDNSARSQASTLTNASISYEFGRATLRLEVFNLFDRRDDDIRYYYTSRLPGEPVSGVDDYAFHPAEPRSFRVGLRLPFRS